MNIFKICLLSFLIAILGCLESFPEPILEAPRQLDNQKKLIYKVEFNGLTVGKIEWNYLGRLNIDDKVADVLGLTPDVKIIKALSLQTKEKLYIDSDTHLPIRVQRQVNFLGRKEVILEEYNQKEGYVKITKTNTKQKEEIIHQKAPIHNVIALLYFFPSDIKLELGKSYSFNLPTKRIDIKVISLEVFDTQNNSYETFCLEGQPRRFKIWLEKKERLPLKIEFPVMLGKVTISKVD